MSNIKVTQNHKLSGVNNSGIEQLKSSNDNQRFINSRSKGYLPKNFMPSYVNHPKLSDPADSFGGFGTSKSIYLIMN